MSTEPQPSQESKPSPRFQLSLDWWAVLTALALVLLVLSGVLSNVPW